VQDVGRFDVPVQVAETVCVGQRGRDRVHQGPQCVAVVLQFRLKLLGGGLGQRHDEPLAPRAEVENRHDVAVPAEQLGDLDLTLHPRGELLAQRLRLLEGDDGLRRLVAGLVDDPHAALVAAPKRELLQRVVVALAAGLPADCSVRIGGMHQWLLLNRGQYGRDMAGDLHQDGVDGADVVRRQRAQQVGGPALGALG
jgi:hypothetical protein